MKRAAKCLWVLLMLAASPCGAADLSAQEVRAILAAATSDKPADLSGKSLEYLDLSNLDFKRANLLGTNLFGAKLDGANLSSGANFTGAKMGADMKNQSMGLMRTALSGANLSRANFSKADLGRALKDALGPGGNGLLEYLRTYSTCAERNAKDD